MKCFDQVPPFTTKVNYVDETNKVVGFDMDSSCCESFGHGVFDYEPNEKTNLDEPSTADISLYSFVDEKPNAFEHSSDDGGGNLSFRISAPNLPDLWVVIWNHHNGYYAHGWTSWNDEGYL